MHKPRPCAHFGVEDVCWPLWGACKAPCSILSMLSWLLGAAGFNQGASSPSGQAHPLVSCRKQSILSAVPLLQAPPGPELAAHMRSPRILTPQQIPDTKERLAPEVLPSGSSRLAGLQTHHVGALSWNLAFSKLAIFCRQEQLGCFESKWLLFP